MLRKELVLKALETMPDIFSIGELEKAILDIKIEVSNKEIEDGKGIDWEDIKREMKTW